MDASASLHKLTERLAVLAAFIQDPGTEAAVTEALGHARTACREVTGAALSGRQQQLLSTVSQALETWEHAWPRLGADREFRHAVAREAQLWSTRLCQP